MHSIHACEVTEHCGRMQGALRTDDNLMKAVPRHSVRQPSPIQQTQIQR